MPQLFNYQGRLTDNAGNPVADDYYTINFFLHHTSDGLSPRWGETQIVTTSDGLFNTTLGSVNSIHDSLFKDQPIYMWIVMDGEFLPIVTAQLVSVAHSLRVATVDGASGGNITSNVTIGQNQINTGDNSFIAGDSNTVTELNSTISGGHGNSISQTGWYSTIAGGQFNTIFDGPSFIGGGEGNTISLLGGLSTIGGGFDNVISGFYATIGGGGNNIASGSDGSTVSGGSFNEASGAFSTVGGGSSNIASGDLSTVPGGSQDTASGRFSFAAGQRASATHKGSFVWGDSFNGNVASSADDQFTARTIGGARFFTNGALTTGVTLAAGGGAWASVSDRNVKENIRSVDGAEILEKLSELDVSRWNYITQDESIEHIGPMAQDFYELFGVDDNNTTIASIDPDGISLAAIKALHQENKELNNRLAKLEKLIEELRKK